MHAALMLLVVGQVLQPPQVVPFSGTEVGVTLGSQHVLRLGDELQDIDLDSGWHRLSEKKATQAHGPLLLIACSKVNQLDGDAAVVGHQGLRTKGPLRFSVFSVEPFLNRFPLLQLRMLNDEGTAIFVAQAAEIVQVPENDRWVRVIGLDPTARYEVEVKGPPGLEQVLVAADLERAPAARAPAADAAWTASRRILRGGGKASLPSTRQLAITVLGAAGINARPVGTTVEVVVRQVKAGAGTLGPRRSVVLPDSADQIARLVRALLADGQHLAAMTLTDQCLAADPRNATCLLLSARASGLGGDLKTAVEQGCKAIRAGEGTPVESEARMTLGVHAAKCR